MKDKHLSEHRSQEEEHNKENKNGLDGPFQEKRKETKEHYFQDTVLSSARHVRKKENHHHILSMFPTWQYVRWMMDATNIMIGTKVT